MSETSPAEGETVTQQVDNMLQQLGALLTEWAREGVPASVALMALTLTAISLARRSGVMTKEGLAGQVVALWDGLDKY